LIKKIIILVTTLNTTIRNNFDQSDFVGYGRLKKYSEYMKR